MADAIMASGVGIVVLGFLFSLAWIAAFNRKDRKR